jgi:hypothetical protein
MTPQAFQFSSPSEYSDWANYSGFNRKTGEQEAPTQSGVAPPTDFSSYLDQRTQPIMDKFNAYSNIAKQVGNGDISGAFATYQNRNAPTPTQVPSSAPPPPSSDISGFEKPFTPPTFGADGGSITDGLSKSIMNSFGMENGGIVDAAKVFLGLH